ncbi:MAG: pyruvate kinase [Candidatus Magasanikbacteria bacterium]|nr:pyruvate kinase [Candidatus Magasanikbacteria bacterium]
MFRATKIGATLGPASATAEVVGQMVRAGLNFARLNFSHGTLESHHALAALLRQLAHEQGEPLALVVDVRGGKIRLGLLPPAGVTVNTGDIITFNTAAVDYQDGEIPLDWPGLPGQLKAGERILLDDGRVEVRVSRLTPERIFAEVSEGGTLASRKGLNFPDSALKLPALQPSDEAALRFAVAVQAEYVALSFITSAREVEAARQTLRRLGAGQQELPALMAKIERGEAVRNIEEIVAAADAIMVARGDLGLELPEEQVPLLQKKLIAVARAAGKPVVVATQLLDSMQLHRRPTRAEVSDVANAVIDHSDALLLTNETATGAYPAEAVATMAEIITTTEASPYDDTVLSTVPKTNVSTEKAVSELSRLLAEEVGAKLILAASISGETGRLISQVRPPLPILVATETEHVARQLNLSWGVKSFVILPCASIEELISRSLLYIKQHQLAAVGDKMIIVAGEPVGQAGNVNLVEVREIR